VVHICRLTEGTPLAIELASAWLRLLSCQEIAQEIEQNLDFLTTSLRNVPERQRSLRAVFDYSWHLLSAEEQRVFRQLAVFRGGFLLEAAKQVTGAALPLLLALVDKSLLRRTDTGRYSRHLLLWQYAAEKLEEAPQEKEKTQAAHSNYYMAFLHWREARLKGGQQREALAEIGAEIENIRTGWQWTIGQDNLTAIEQALESLFHFYDVRSWFQEGAEVFGSAADSLARTHPFDGQTGAQVQPAAMPYQILTGKLLARQGWFTFQLGQHGPAKALLEVSLTILRQAGPQTRREMIFSLNYLGAVHRHLSEYETARHYLQESLAICREAGDTFGLSIALNILSQVAFLEGDYEQARRLSRESLALKQQIGDRRGMTFSLNILGQVAYALLECPQAKAFFEESLAICQDIGDRRGIALSLSHLGDVVQMMAEYQGARQLYQESRSIFKEIGNQWGLITASTRLGYVTNHLGDTETARDYFYSALKMSIAIQAVPGALDALLGLASLWIKTGQGSQAEAMEILALALSHPASSRDHQNKAARLLADLQPYSGTAQAVRTGEQVETLEIVAKRILGEEHSARR
jgi:tetratricopeptide (TPR) repeat protein